MEKEMTLKEANYQVEKWENELKLLLDKKESLERIVDIHGTSYDKVLVDGGKHEDRMLLYQMLKEATHLDMNIKILQDKIKANLEWIDNELKLLQKYGKVEQVIVFYKELISKEYTWATISNIVHFSESQCRRIYRKYKKKKIFQDEQL